MRFGRRHWRGWHGRFDRSRADLVLEPLAPALADGLRWHTLTGRVGHRRLGLDQRRLRLVQRRLRLDLRDGPFVAEAARLSPHHITIPVWAVAVLPTTIRPSILSISIGIVIAALLVAAALIMTGPAILEAPVVAIKAVAAAVIAIKPVIVAVVAAIVAIVVLLLALAMIIAIIAVLVVVLRPVVVIALLGRLMFERTRLVHRLRRGAFTLAHNGLNISAELVTIIIAKLVAAIHRVLRPNHRARRAVHAVGERIGAALAHLLLAKGHDDAVIVLSVLHIVLGQHRVAGRMRIARQLHIFFRNMRRRAAQLDIRPGALKAPRQRILRLAVSVVRVVVVIIATATAAAILLSLPHGLPFKVC